MCQSVCPVNNVKICNGRPKWLHKCELCMACINYCPQKTIQWVDSHLKEEGTITKILW
jgi:MinD superfamily P-loop ATPase